MALDIEWDDWNERTEGRRLLREVVESTGILDHLVDMAKSTKMNNLDLKMVVNMSDEKYLASCQISTSEEMDIYHLLIRDENGSNKFITSIGKLYK